MLLEQITKYILIKQTTTHSLILIFSSIKSNGRSKPVVATKFVNPKTSQ